MSPYEVFSDVTVITGDTRSMDLVKFLRTKGWGRMFIHKKIVPYPEEPWGFDNGAFRDWVSGKNFDEKRYLTALERAVEIAQESHFPYLSVLPDLVAQGRRSLEFSVEWLFRIESLLGKELSDRMNWYLAVQDGIKEEEVEEVLQEFPQIRGVFLGGTDEFKLTASVWSSIAKRNGRKFHYARAGTPKKVVHAKLSGADSLDSAFPLWVRERLEYFVRGSERLYRFHSSQRELFPVEV